MYLVAIAADHAGFELKEACKANLTQAGIEVRDFGTHNQNSVDYPDFVHPVAKFLQEHSEYKGILICGSGQGVCITANRYTHIRAALCWEKNIAALARKHNDANVLCLPARFVTPQDSFDIIQTFLTTPFEGGRHQVRIDKIN
ncbi:MAG: ribose 5-phosphate isomerase B [Bacteroidia bacterium]|nr:ribose 5-phosphate isomerase B [Bacteroidia bacterium]